MFAIFVDNCKFAIFDKYVTFNSESAEFSLPGYEFEFVPTPLAFGGVGMFIDETLHYTILEKTSHEAFQALWIELSFASKKEYNLWHYLQTT